MLLQAIIALCLIQDTPEPEARPDIIEAGELIGLDFTEDEAKQMARDVAQQLRSYETLRAQVIPNSVQPTGAFTPLVPGLVLNQHKRDQAPAAKSATAPEQWREQLFDLSIPQLGVLLRAGDLTCLELTEAYLENLERLDEKLHCVVTLLPERSLAQAKRLDAELEEGIDRGPLHGIPWGAKDLLAVAGAPTTWGAAPFEQQVIDQDAAVVQRLDDAGAVLIAKLSLGSLAMGDVWFGGTTRNPWNPERGSSGSSAGPAAAVAAGGVAFAIGSETLGSIVSPSTRCGVTSIRPSFGRVSRDGAMALSWSMDKLGPMARSFQDAWLVQQEITGPPESIGAETFRPEMDASVVDIELLDPDGYGLKKVRVGVPVGAFTGRDAGLSVVLDELRGALEAKGGTMEVVDVELPAYPTEAMLITLMAEAATAFDELTRSGKDDELVAQGPYAWPTAFRAARLIPAVEYLTAQRLRGGLILDFEAMMSEVDLLVHPPFALDLLAMTNLTGHPTLVAPVFLEPGGQQPSSICFTGRLYDEGYVLSVARLWQGVEGYHLRHPNLE
ncbi:MAG: Asp-tRNA(Asn)/Glu-tRNA(Gln) amidotransferase A subunit family amidase [Bacteroidia bacterium]|jgi:Asp-tRNA(Asn)/Glu-tRNA(Gln) amidotransferase A subunit family amidase